MSETSQALLTRSCKRMQRDAPCEHCAEAAHDGCVQHVMKEDAAGEPDDGCLDEECERRVGEGEIAIGKLAVGDARGGVEYVAEVPEDGDVRILPEDDGGRGGEEADGGEPVAQRPARRGSLTIRDGSSRRSRGRSR